jgi:A/G-specific adenine glycosylase
VKRVLCRVAALQEWPGRQGPTRKLWALAERHTPAERVCDYTQAIMDLGATLCTRSRPVCEKCPLQDGCTAFQLNLVSELPVRKPGKVIPTRHRFVFIRLRESGHVYLEQRAPTGIWGGLWSLPEGDVDTSLEDATRLALAKGWLPSDSAFEHRPAFRHRFSHYHLVLQPLIIKQAVSETQVQERSGEWFEVSETSLPALPAPIKKWLLQAEFGLQQTTTPNSKR